MNRAFTFISAALLSANLMSQTNTSTQRQYLSGKGCDDMVQWDFYCTGGNNSGKWSKIGVPSCWELQGFGTYQYGMKFYGKAFPEGIADEKGLYKYEFNLPKEWNGRDIELVFEASMTDTEVKINGRKAGTEHQGGFYRFIYNVSDRVFFGGKKNVLEVTVSKESKNAGVNLAERRADYWNFGGLIRPVFIVSKPAQNIAHHTVNALSDGTFTANCFLNMAVEGAKIETSILNSKGKSVAHSISEFRRGSDVALVSLKVENPLLWSAETPNLYTAVFTLVDKNGKEVHREQQKFGFRTIETRESDGLYINGTKVLIKGVNRHSFRPESGRTLSKVKNIEDVLLIKSMNMNAVRLSHYPADPEFFEACDSLGLYVMDELTGWHGKHETIVGQKLVKEMVMRDVNHPSIIWWSNGNEKGWNTELDCEFHKYDPQKRAVLHPQGNFSGYETMHYRSYGESQNYMRLPEIFMPTEFLHGLYDGGHGGGLYDYWEMMRKHPRCAGGFLWVLADEGVKRVDMNGFIDNVGNYGADGIVGPHHEKEGSYYTIKRIWSPIQIMNRSMTDNFDGRIIVENRYDFKNLKGCIFDCTFVQLPSSKVGILSGNIDKEVKKIFNKRVTGVYIAPKKSGEFMLPSSVNGANALMIKAIDDNGNELFTWCYKLKDIEVLQTKSVNSVVEYVKSDDGVKVAAAGRTLFFSNKDGYLKYVEKDGRKINLHNGPRFIAARRADRSLDQFYNHDDIDAEKKKTQYTTFDDLGKFVGFDIKKDGDILRITANYKLGCFDKAQWSVMPDGTVVLDYNYNFSGVTDIMGVMFDYPEDKVKAKTWVGNGPYRVWQNRVHGPELGLWRNESNDPIPGESFDYPEFKGYFANVQWITLDTEEGKITIINHKPENYIGVYQPRDGRDELLYTLPNSGISILNVIPPVRNKVNTTDLIGPSSQPFWADGNYSGKITLKFD